VSSWWWYLTKSSGIVATVLLALSFMWGLLFSGRATGKRLRANWWLALHNWLGGMALAFIGVHIVAAFLDSNAGIGLAQILIPGTATGWVWPIAWGVVATYIFTVTVFTSVNRVKRLIPRRTWYVIHLLSIPALIMTALHVYQTASDIDSPAYGVMLAVLAGISVYPAVLRVIGIVNVRRAG
jgi:predicted ferric reductase